MPCPATGFHTLAIPDAAKVMKQEQDVTERRSTRYASASRACGVCEERDNALVPAFGNGLERTSLSQLLHRSIGESAMGSEDGAGLDAEARRLFARYGQQSARWRGLSWDMLREDTRRMFRREAEWERSAKG